MKVETPIQQGTKHDEGKPMVGLLPAEAIIEVSKVFTFGAKKYDSHNWRKGFIWSRVYDAVLRHVFAWVSGENKDPESGLSHLAHAIAGLMMLITFEKTGTGNDDRYVQTPISNTEDYPVPL